MKKFLQQLIKGAITEIVKDLEEEYLEEVVYDYYYVKYTIAKRKYEVFFKLEHKGNFTYELDKKIRIAHKKDGEDALSFSVDNIFKL